MSTTSFSALLARRKMLLRYKQDKEYEAASDKVELVLERSNTMTTEQWLKVKREFHRIQDDVYHGVMQEDYTFPSQHMLFIALSRVLNPIGEGLQQEEEEEVEEEEEEEEEEKEEEEENKKKTKKQKL